MPAATLQQINALPDPLDQTRFLLNLGIIPGSGESRNLSLKCSNSSIPGRSNELFETNLGGHQRKTRGRNMYPRILSCTFIEDVTGDTHTKLQGWLEFMAGTNSGNSGGYSNQYGIVAELSVYDTIGAESMRYTMYAFKAADLADTNLSSESSAGVQVQMQFSYDYYTSSTFSVR